MTGAGGGPAATAGDGRRTAGDSRRLLLDVGNTVGTLAGIRDAVFLGPEIQAALEDAAHADDKNGELRRLGLFSSKKRSRPLD
jgi:hypothetical protein